MGIPDRVALRVALVFESPDTYQSYMQAHPGADPSKHSIQVPAKKPEKSEAPHGDKGHGKDDHGDKGHGDGHGDEHGHGPKKSLKEKLTELKDALKKAPKDLQKFVKDKDHREQTLKDTAAKIKKSPKAYLSNLKSVWNHEKKEFADAGKGVAAIMKGKKASAHQKHAIKAVSKHLALTVGYSLATASGAGVGTAILLSTLKYISIKAASETMASLYVLKKGGIITESLLGLMDKIASDEKSSPEEALSALVLMKMMEQMEKGLSDEEMSEALQDLDAEGIESFDPKEADPNKGDKISEKVARRFLATSPAALLVEIQGELKKMRAWAKTFRYTFQDSLKDSQDAPRGYVWQAPWVDFWDPFDPIQRKLYDLGAKLERLDPELAASVDPYLEPPRSARIEEAISDPKFAEEDGKDQIAYPEKSLVAWHKAFEGWVSSAIDGVGDLLKS